MFADYERIIDGVKSPLAFQLYKGNAYNLKWTEFKSIMKTKGYNIGNVAYEYNNSLMNGAFAAKLLKLCIKEIF